MKLINRQLYLNGDSSPIRLRPMEARLLSTLMRYPNRPVSRATLMYEVWQTDYVDDTRTLEVHISCLRRKIETNPTSPERIITVRGVGYLLCV